jgi:ABC-type glycerol-3-phosphate transport system substrate-binding protein
MKKLSIFQITLLAIFGALAVAGVLIFSFAIGGSTQTSLGKVVIWGTLDGNAFAAVIRAAAEQDPTLSQVSYVQKDPATFDSDLTKALASGTGPDLFLLQQDYAFKDQAQIAVIPAASLSQTSFENTFVDASAPFFGKSGALAIPLIVDPLVLYWNKDLLTAGGYSQPPSYWDQFLGMAQKLSSKDPSGAIQKSAIDFGEYQNVDNAKAVLSTLILQAGGALTDFDTSGRLISALLPKTGTASTGAESALRFYTDFADPSSDYYSWNRALPDAQQYFAQGRLALYIGYASERAAIARSNPNLNFGIAPVPQTRATTLTGARVYALAASRTGLNPSAAITAAAALANTDNAQAIATALGLPSARRDVLSIVSQRQLPAELVSQGDICKGIDVIVCSAQIARTWVDPDPDATNGIFQTMIETTTSGTSLPIQAIQRADQSMTQIVSQEQSAPQ